MYTVVYSIRFLTRTKMKILLRVLLLILIQGNIKVKSSATIEWLLISYENPGGKDNNGDTCDVIITLDCDHVFRFELFRGSDSTPIFLQQTTPFYNKNSVSFPSNQHINGIYNPMTYTFPKWPGVVSLKVHVEDDDYPLRSDFVDEFTYRLETTPTPKNSAVPTTDSARGRTTLQFTWKVYCDENYYGDDCTKSCTPSNDPTNGHYLCNVNGDKICMPGWEDVTTDCLKKKDNCKDNKCENGATCQNGDDSYTCVCRSQFEGTYCEINIDKCFTQPCQNDAWCKNLKNDYICTCKPGYVGKNCSEKACMITNPCQNGGTCYENSKCFCPPYFLGQVCQDPLCKVVGCLNDGICSINGTCACKPGFQGGRCEVNLCDTVDKFCRNGGTCVGGICKCPKEFIGDSCEESISCNDRTCINGVCAMPDAQNASTMVPHCQCNQGYSGVMCDKVGVGKTLPNRYEPDNSMPLFTILFIIFVIISFVLLIIVIVLVAILCKKRRLPKPHARSDSTFHSSSQSDYEVYSTIAKSYIPGESMGSHSNTTIPNLYHEDDTSFTQDLDRFKKELSLDVVYIPAEEKY